MPAQIQPGWSAPPALSAQTVSTEGAFSSGFSSGGSTAGKAGAFSSVQVRPWSRERCSFTPKWPSLKAAYIAPSRGSVSTADTGSPRNAGGPAVQPSP